MRQIICWGIFANLGYKYPDTNPRGINEALTEWISLKQAGIEGIGDSGYFRNVAHLDRILSILENAGYNNLGERSYYTDQSGLLANALCDNAGILYYDELVKKMNIADGCGGITDQVAIDQANIEINALIDLLEKIMKR